MLGGRPRAVVMGAEVSSELLLALEAQVVVELQPIHVSLPVGADLVLLDGGGPIEAVGAVLDGIGPLGGARPVVLLLVQGSTTVPAEWLEKVDDVVNLGVSEMEIVTRVRAALRARATLLELQRKNAELEVLYGRVEVLAGRMAEELRLASQVQRSLLPPPFHHESLEVAREYIPVREIGGDYYDLLPLDSHRLAFAIGDVMGKGVPAALLAANLKACLRAQLQSTDGLDPRQMITRVNRLFWEVTPKGLFASLFFGVLDLARGRLEFVNAGHDHPFIVRADGSLLDLEEGGTVLGLLESSRYERGLIPVYPGDRIVLFSDGITDRSNVDGELFGVGRLKDAVLRNRGGSVRLALYSLLGEIQGFSGGLPAEDDMTLILAQVH